jgi:hypothetical protein
LALVSRLWMMKGSELASSSRSRLIQELEYSRRLGLKAFQTLVAGLDPAELDLVWDEYSPIFTQLITAQQDAGRRASLAYLTVAGVAMGYPVARALLPAEAATRVGRLPSGMPVAALVSTVPVAVAHRVQNGATVEEAWQKSLGYLTSAVSDAVHTESRNVMTDVLKSESVSFDDYDERVRAWRQEIADDRAMGDSRFETSLSDMVRYARVPSPNACPFCLLLATRGAIYFRDSFSSSDASSRRFNGDGGARVHFNCRCTLIAEPLPGAFDGTVFGDAKQFETATWKDTRKQTEYNLSTFVKKKTVLAGQGSSYVLAS